MANVTSNDKYFINIPLSKNFLDYGRAKRPTSVIGTCYIDDTGGPDGKGCGIFTGQSYLRIDGDLELTNKQFSLGVYVKYIVPPTPMSFDGVLSIQALEGLDHANITITSVPSVCWVSTTGFNWNISNSSSHNFNIQLNDSDWHYLELRRRGDNLTVSVDDVVQLQTTMSPELEFVNKGPYIILGKKSDLLLSNSIIAMQNFTFSFDDE